jgi:hypothetical protein
VAAIRPYVATGVAWDSLSGIHEGITSTIIGSHTVTTSSTGHPAELNKSTTAGFVAGTGIDLHVIGLHFLPEIRFTHWGSAHFSDTNNLLHSNQNQAEVLVGITF